MTCAMALGKKGGSSAALLSSLGKGEQQMLKGWLGGLWHAPNHSPPQEPPQDLAAKGKAPAQGAAKSANIIGLLGDSEGCQTPEGV